MDVTTLDTEQMLRAAGLRATGPRTTVLAAVHAHPHAGADAIVDEVRRVGSDLSRRAVNDSLRALVDAGLVRRFYVGAGAAGSGARFEVKADEHQHVVCTVCDRIADVDGTDLPHPVDTHGFVIKSAEVVYEGLCPVCTGRPDEGPHPTTTTSTTTPSPGTTIAALAPSPAMSPAASTTPGATATAPSTAMTHSPSMRPDATMSPSDDVPRLSTLVCPREPPAISMPTSTVSPATTVSPTTTVLSGTTEPSLAAPSVTHRDLSAAVRAHPALKSGSDVPRPAALLCSPESVSTLAALHSALELLPDEPHPPRPGPTRRSVRDPLAPALPRRRAHALPEPEPISGPTSTVPAWLSQHEPVPIR